MQCAAHFDAGQTPGSRQTSSLPPCLQNPAAEALVPEPLSSAAMPKTPPLYSQISGASRACTGWRHDADSLGKNWWQQFGAWRMSCYLLVEFVLLELVRWCHCCQVWNVDGNHVASTDQWLRKYQLSLMAAKYSWLVLFQINHIYCHFQNGDGAF